MQSQLEAQYTITKPTDDKSDIVKAGAVLILEKDKLIMYPTSNQVVPQNTYKDGKLSEGAFGVHHKVQSFGSFIGHPLPDQAQVTPRNFVTGEKFWVTRIDVESDGVTFTLFSDPYNDVRYDSTLKFIFPHGQVPAADQVLKTVAEVLKVDADDAKKDDSGNQQQAAGGDANNQQQAPAAGDADQQAAASGGRCPGSSACSSASHCGDRPNARSSDCDSRAAGKDHQPGREADLCVQGSESNVCEGQGYRRAVSGSFGGVHAEFVLKLDVRLSHALMADACD